MDSTTGATAVTLARHPQTPSGAVEGIDVLLQFAPGASLSLDFVLEGDVSRLRIPEPGSPGRADGLWRHTCFEAFLMAGEGPGYREFNFSPSGEWAVYDFRGYRNGGEPEAGLAPTIGVHRARNRLQLEAQIDRDSLPRGGSLRLGLSAVVEDADGVLSYWALRHPPGKPDFHHADSFVLHLALP